MLVCPKCFKYRSISDYITFKGVEGICHGCGASGEPVIEASRLQDRFVRLSDYYTAFAEWELDDDEPYDGPGGLLSDLLQQEWGIWAREFDVYKIDDFLEKVFPYFDLRCLYAPPDMWHESPDDEFKRLARKLMHDRRFFVKPVGLFERDLDELLGESLEDFVNLTLPTRWFRARKHFRVVGDNKPDAYSQTQIGAPDPQGVFRGGRANPAGISYLYLSSTLDTVIAEVRADQGDFVSVGSFEIPPRLRVIDLAQSLKRLDPFISGPPLAREIERRILLREFSRWLSRPVREEEHELNYVVTQYLSEYILSKGYQGIQFRSALTKGKDLVVFDPQVCTCVSVVQHRIKTATIQYEYEAVKS